MTLMMIKNVCRKCGGEIEMDRLALLDTPICAKCASKEHGNILHPDIRIAELEHAVKTMADAHHTALEVERKKAIDYQEKCVALEFEIEALKRKVRELESEIGMREMLKTAGRQAELDAMQNMLNRNKELEAQLTQAQDRIGILDAKVHLQVTSQGGGEK